MNVNDIQEYEITLEKMVYGGDAMGRLPDGRAVFVPYALPGERVRMRVVEQKRGHVRAELVEILAASPKRVAPRCQHFGTCGGCHYQHIAYPDQLELKRGILVDQFERIGGLVNIPVRSVLAAEHEWEYRNHVQFHLTQDGKLGYMQARSDQVIPIKECHLPDPLIKHAWPQLDFESLPGLERIGLRAGVGEEMQLILESQDIQAPEVSVEGLPVSVVHISPAGTLVLAGSEQLTMSVLGRNFRVSAGSFFQVNLGVAELITQHLIENLPDRASKKVCLELYCGVGLFSYFLAPKFGHYIGIEVSPSAVDDFSVNLDEYDHVEIYEATVEAALPAIDVQPDVVLVDPPRTGLTAKALDAIVQLDTPYVVYVSCDPATLARDGKRLAAGGFRLANSTIFDMFPQTFHIESVSIWER